MRNLKRVLSLAMALVMVLGMMVITTNAADFTDAEEITYKEAVEVMSSLGILNGYEAADGTYSFNPTGTLERDEAAKIIAYVAMGADVDEYLAPTEPYFTDIADSWAAKYINVLVNLKVVDGNGDGTYNPDGKLTVAQFAKMLLLAAGVEGEFTGPEWKTNVKDAFNAEAVLKATGLKITEEDPYITREEACHMALAAMKVGTTTIKYVVYDDNGTTDVTTDDEVLATYDNARDAALDVQLFNNVDIKYKKVSVPQNLLKDVYQVTVDAENETDAFGRPGYTYTNGKTGAAKLEMFYANEALAKFEGPVAQKDIFAAAKAAATATSITYTIIEDGVNITSAWKYVTGSAAKDNKESTTDEEFAAGTGYGIKSELYKDAAGNYTLVSIREYLGTVKKVTPADEKDPTSKRTITVELTVLPTGREESAEIVYTTEDFAAKDVVVVTVAGAKIQTIALAETVKGAVTKLDNGVATIGGKEYVSSQNASDVTLAMDGKEYSWYVDSFGNLLKSVDAPTPPATVYFYGIFVDAEGQLYKAAGEDTLLTEGKDGQEAAEVIKLLTAEGKEVVFNTAWEYVLDEDDEIVDVEFINAAKQSVLGDTYVATLDKAEVDGDQNKLVKYALDEDGKITEIGLVETYDADNGKLEAGKAVLGEGFDYVVTDKTVFFVKDTTATTPKWVVYTGYKTVPTIEFTNDVYYVAGKTAAGAADGTYAIVMIEGAAVEEEKAPEYSYIYFADTKFATEWDAAANEGKGAIVYVYENVYLDGVKTTVKFAAEQTKAAKGALYAYTVNAKGVMSIVWSNLLVETDVVSLNMGDFFKAGADVHYVTDATVFYQISATGMTKVEALPTVETGESIVVKYVLSETLANKDVVAAAVYFTVEETAKIDTSVVTVATKEELAAAVAAGGKIVLIDNVTLDSKLTVAKDVTIDLNGYTLTVPAVESNYSVVVSGKLTINDHTNTGRVVTAETALYGIGVSATGTLTVNGGTFYGPLADYLIGVWGTATINDGVFSAEYCNVNSFGGGNVAITGGSFSVFNKTWTEDCGWDAGEDLFADGTLVVTGGTFSTDPTEFVATGYEVTGEGPYTVVAE